MPVTHHGSAVAGRRGSSGRTLLAAVATMLLLAAGCADADPEQGAAAPTGGEQPTPVGGAETTAAGDGATATAGDDATAGSCDGAAELAGEELEIAIPFPPGGGFDRHARVIGEALGEAFDITPVPVNEPGAGGLLTLNQHITHAPDELRIQYVQTPAAVAAQLAGADGAGFSLEEWPWLARVTIDDQLAIASNQSGFQSLEDAFGGERLPRIGALGPGGIDYLHGEVLPAVMDADAELVTGFGSPNEAVLSVASGDIDMYVLDHRALLPAVQAGDAVALAHIARDASDELPDLPVITDLVPAGSAQAELLEDYLNLVEIGRGLAAVPGADEARVETLRCMLEVVLNDPEVVELIEIEGDRMAYATGPEMGASIEQAMQAGEEFVQMLEESF